jgi:hypothetical protein
MGIAVRSKCCLDLDLAGGFWKDLLGFQRDALDLKAVDFTAWQGFQFCDPSCGAPFDEDDFDDYFSELTYTTVLSDGTTHELKAGGAQERVAFADRWAYARMATQARSICQSPSTSFLSVTDLSTAGLKKARCRWNAFVVASFLLYPQRLR